MASSGSETHERKHLMSTTHDVINPATEEVVSTLDLVGVEETDAAIAKAVEVWTGRAVSPADRERCCDASPMSWRSTPRNWHASR